DIAPGTRQAVARQAGKAEQCGVTDLASTACSAGPGRRNHKGPKPDFGRAWACEAVTRLYHGKCQARRHPIASRGRPFTASIACARIPCMKTAREPDPAQR